MLFDKGLFKYEDRISKYWPEFALNGKEQVRIADVLRHESGLAWFTESIPSIRDAWKDNVKRNKIGRIIEDQPLHFPEYEHLDSQSEYHTITRGLIVNELVRRIDPKVIQVPPSQLRSFTIALLHNCAHLILYEFRAPSQLRSFSFLTSNFEA